MMKFVRVAIHRIVNMNCHEIDIVLFRWKKKHNQKVTKQSTNGQIFFNFYFSELNEEQQTLISHKKRHKEASTHTQPAPAFNLKLKNKQTYNITAGLINSSPVLIGSSFREIAGTKRLATKKQQLYKLNTTRTQTTINLYQVL